jgi:hypothetical protein
MPKRCAWAATWFILAVVPSARSQEPPVTGEVWELRRQVGALQSAVDQQAEQATAVRKSLAAVAKELGALSEALAGLGDRSAAPAATFLAGPPASTDAVGVAKVAVFAPRVAVDASRRHDLITLRLRRMEADALRPVAEVELGRDEQAVDLPLDRNGALYVVDWAAGEGNSFDLMLRDGAGGAESGLPAATVRVKPYQGQGRFLFVGYRVE